MKFLKQILIVVIVIIITSVVVKAGDEFFGKKESDDGNNCEAGMVLVESSSGSFCIDIYENSPGEDCYEIEIDNQLDTSRNLNKKECIPVSEKERQPWKYISQTQARVACAKAGKRLPTSREWYLASLGISDLSDDWSKHDCHVDSNWDTQPGLTGSGRNCVSAYGAYDMIGNLWEWVDEEISDGMLDDKKMPEAGYVVEVNKKGIPIKTSTIQDENFNNDYLWIKIKGIKGMARGGSWKNNKKAGIYSMYLVSPTSYTGVGVGFRCVK
ncbi:SUMF1/EgtB/PvdO family nonheme iron enzyme [Candidatus Parcubacteria bacterium]|nr:SUMF1/EgtB/PvdO family nonheme iron enzyme [Candidatus Parcubacteria bacterium]